MTTINDVAKLANVSKSTISYVFSNKRTVSPMVRERVLKACRELSYTPNFFAVNMFSNNSNLIGLFFEPNNANYYPFYNDVIQACIISLQKFGMRVIPYLNVTQEDIVTMLKNRRAPIMGAIILAPQVLDERIKLFTKDNLPFVLIGEPEKRIGNLLNVDNDNSGLTKRIFSYAYENGHRNILFINAVSELTIAKYREKALGKFIVAHPDLHVKTIHVVNEPGRVYEELSTDGNDYSCVITASDVMAKDVYEFYTEQGMELGRDVSVIAFGGDERNGLIPKLTIARQNYPEICASAVDLLIKLLKSETKPPAETVLIPSELIIGGSVADINIRS
ncbi:MAG: LacI family transcriptional regulator [Clostridiales bacterium]|jgi:DNA-binding LacI/PurR family transcriptional regulator|nr:LacI family transcriptional regulator [Clostridiales bacterium]